MIIDPATTSTLIQVVPHAIAVAERHFSENKRGSFEEKRLVSEEERFEKQQQLQQGLLARKHFFDLAIKDVEKNHQRDLVAWKSEKEGELLIKKQLFDKKEGKKNRKLQRELVEKKIAADKRLQEYLSRSNQEFQAKLEAIKRDTQLTIAEFTKQMDVLIAKDNRQFQTWLFFEQRKLQEELAEYNRETQLQVVQAQKQTAIDRITYEKIMGEWPLNLTHQEILDSHPKNNFAPLRVIMIPPVIDYDSTGQMKQYLPNHEKRLAQGIRDFVQNNYPLQGNTPVKFLGGAWKSNKYKGEVAIDRLFHFLPSEPILLLDSEVDDEFFNLRIAYWNGHSESYHSQSVISGLPYTELLKKWAIERMGKQATQANFEPEDYKKFSQFMIACQRLLIGFFADFHYQLFHDMPPKFSSYLSELYDSFPDDETRQLMFDHFMKSHDATFTATAEIMEKDYFLPDFKLQLAEGLATLPDKSWAEKQLIACMKSWLDLRVMNVSTLEDVRELFNTVCNSSDEDTGKDNDFLFRLNAIKKQTQAIEAKP